MLGKLKGEDRQEKPRQFLALELTNEVVVAAVWQIVAQQTEIVSLGTPVEWDGFKANVDELIRAVDATISSSTEGIPGDISEIIFGVSPGWAETEGITPEKISLIKKLCTELELKPLGFVVITDALLRYLKMQEGTPTTSILVGLSGDTLTLSLVYQGKIKATESVGRGDDISSDVEEGLSRIIHDRKDELPSRILVYNGMHSVDDEVQNLLSYDWQLKFNFLHIPKIESLPKDVVIRSIAVAGGMEVARSIGFEVVEPAPAEVVDSAPAPELVPPENLGFSSDAPLAEPPVSLPPVSKITLTNDSPPPPLPPKVAAPARYNRPRWRLPSLKKVFGQLSFPSIDFSGRGKLTFSLAAIFAVILLGYVIFVWQVPRAAVSIQVEPRYMEEIVDIVLSQSASTIDLDSSTIPASLVATTVTGQDSLTTTGKKLIGDPAVGSVTVYNRTSLTKTFPAGTILKQGNLSFKLDSDVTVASKSAGADYVDVPGKAEASVTAVAIGEEGNLPSGTEFTLEDFSVSSYVARSINNFSGGSSSEVQAVSQSDQDNLEEALLTKLMDQAEQQLIASLDQDLGVFLLPESAELNQQTFSHQVGEEASTLSVEMELTVSGLSFQKADVVTLASSVIDAAMPPGYLKTDQPPTITEDVLKSEGESSLALSVKIGVSLLPALDETEIKERLRGLPAFQVRPTLVNTIGIRDAQVDISPLWLPPRIKRMPRNLDNISIQVTANPQ